MTPMSSSGAPLLSGTVTQQPEAVRRPRTPSSSPMRTVQTAPERVESPPRRPDVHRGRSCRSCGHQPACLRPHPSTVKGLRSACGGQPSAALDCGASVRPLGRIAGRRGLPKANGRLVSPLDELLRTRARKYEEPFAPHPARIKPGSPDSIGVVLASFTSAFPFFI
jgi:hypothetical protein